jgi:DNA repair protein RecO (recombination protein O)
MQNQTCFLLSYIKYGDYDAFLHCFSAETGYQSFFVKGIYTARNKKKPYLFPLNLLTISLRKSGKTSMVSKLELAADAHDLNDVKINSILFFVADFLQQILREEGQNTAAFSEITRFHEEIKNNNLDAFVVLIFNFITITGVAPLISNNKFLDPESGTFSAAIAHPVFTQDISGIWSDYLTVDHPYSIRLKRAERNDFLDSMMVYYHLHFSGFYTPHSLDVLRQIFE